MSEQELIEEGFQRVEVLTDESDNLNDYYYYVLRLNPEFLLSSNESDEIYKDDWKVHCYEINVIIKDIEDIQNIIALHKKWSKY